MRLGFDAVCAVDDDEPAVSAAVANALINGVRFDVRCMDAAGAAALPWPAEVVVADVALRPIVAMGRSFGVAGSRRAPRPRDVIRAGLLHAQGREVLAAWPACAEIARLREDEWTALHPRPLADAAVGPGPA